ncbi:MAG TPA: hypothetical protein VGQ13_03655 [Nitrososphaera sp.]|nr:hypothetical protein [Nitrososphaera sp.]
MSILGQIGLTQSLHRITTVIQVPRYVRSITYDKVYQQFERPHDALGNRHQNPFNRIYRKIVNISSIVIGNLRTVQRSFRIVPQSLSRIEIVVRVRPKWDN